MNQFAELVVIGTITDIDTRRGVGDKGPWAITTAYLSGRRTSYAVTLNDELAAELSVGDDVMLSVYTTVYNGRVDYRATGHYSPAVVPTRSTDAE